MVIGILKEPETENRVILLPEITAQLVKMNVAVKVETNAGARAFATDKDYETGGATITNRDDILASSDLVLSINRISDAETAKMKSNAALLSVFQPLFNKDFALKLLEAGITSFSMDMVPRTTRAQSMDILSSQATVAGYKAVLAAASHLP